MSSQKNSDQHQVISDVRARGDLTATGWQYDPTTGQTQQDTWTPTPDGVDGWKMKVGSFASGKAHFWRPDESGVKPGLHKYFGPQGWNCDTEKVTYDGHTVGSLDNAACAFAHEIDLRTALVKASSNASSSKGGSTGHRPPKPESSVKVAAKIACPSLYDPNAPPVELDLSFSCAPKFSVYGGDQELWTVNSDGHVLSFQARPGIGGGRA